MFQVRAEYGQGDDWQSVEESLYTTAGRVSDFAGTGDFCGRPLRGHGWIVPEFDDAIAIKDRLNKIPGVLATIRET